MILHMKIFKEASNWVLLRRTHRMSKQTPWKCKLQSALSCYFLLNQYWSLKCYCTWKLLLCSALKDINVDFFIANQEAIIKDAKYWYK